MTNYLEAPDIESIHSALVEFFQDSEDPIVPAGVRDPNLLESAVTRPHTGLGRVEKYRSLSQKAAALMHSLIHDHPFHNGNKRAALVSTLAFIQRNGHWLRTTDSDLFSFTLSVAGHSLLDVVLNHKQGSRSDQEVAAMAQWIQSRLRSIGTGFSAMTLHEFLDAVQALGGSYRQAPSGGSWVVLGRDLADRVRISQSTRMLDGQVIKAYIGRLQLAKGTDADELRDGVSGETSLIREFREVIRGLARFDRAD